MNTVQLIRAANPRADCVAVGEVERTDQLFIHHWGTGMQQLIFKSTAAAQAFARSNNCRFIPGAV